MKSAKKSKALSRPERRRREWLMEMKKLHTGRGFILIRRGDEMELYGLLDKQELQWMKESSPSPESKES